MVEQIDENVGRVIQRLEDDGELANTVSRALRSQPVAHDCDQFVLFMSDK